MTPKQIGILIVILVVIGVIAVAAQVLLKEVIPSSNNGGVIPDGVACTMEAKMCPDGSYVGRIPPSCAFAACPLTPASSTQLYKAKIGQIVGPTTLTINPLEVTDDSRCPANVQCVWAGTVKVKTQVVRNGTTTAENFELAVPRTFGSTTITLVEVLPQPTPSTKIPKESYELTFEFRK